MGSYIYEYLPEVSSHLGMMFYAFLAYLVMILGRWLWQSPDNEMP